MRHPHGRCCRSPAGCEDCTGPFCLFQGGHKECHQIRGPNPDAPTSNAGLHRAPCRNQCFPAHSSHSRWTGIAYPHRDQHIGRCGLLHSSCTLLPRIACLLHARHRIGSRHAHSSCNLQLNSVCHLHGPCRMVCYPLLPWDNRGVCISFHHRELCKN